MRKHHRILVKSAILVSVSLGLTAAPPNEVAEADHDCETDGTWLVCNLQPSGTHSYVIDDNTHGLLVLRNTTFPEQYIQVNQVWADPVVNTTWGEFCVYRDYLVLGQYDPKNNNHETAGQGNVGCITKEANEPDFPIPGLRWGGPTTALMVPPRDPNHPENRTVLYIGGYVKEAVPDSDEDDEDRKMTFHVSTTPASSAVGSWRQPKMDEVFTCNGQLQMTDFTPWTNNNSFNLVISGATIYAAAPATGEHEVDGAQISILDTSGAVRWTYAGAGDNARGQIDFSDQVVAPNEQIVGRGWNTCTVGAWDWAAYIHTRPQ